MEPHENAVDSLLPTPFKSSLLLTQKHLQHGFFSREGGVSQGFLASLNTRDSNPEEQKNVQENYNRISASFGLSAQHLVLMKQVHGKTVLWVDEAPPLSRRLEGDALITGNPQTILCIRAADCVPVLVYDPVFHICAAIHAGWKGALLNIVQETINVMKGRGSAPHTILTAIGPCIRQENYEVGEEVYLSFKKSRSSWGKFFKQGEKKGHYWFDLPGIIRDQLQEAGLREIDCFDRDTYTDEKTFFSYRRSHHRQEQIYGNQASAICLSPLIL